VSQTTSGREIASHKIVIGLVVCDQADTERPRARPDEVDLVTTPSSGSAVEERPVLVGERSGGGNCRGWDLVDTIVFFLSHVINLKYKVFGIDDLNWNERL
jgi:hypothetical protein